MVTLNNNKNSNLIVGNDGVPIQFIPPVPPPKPIPPVDPSVTPTPNDDKSSLSTTVPNANAAVMNGTPPASALYNTVGSNGSTDTDDGPKVSEPPVNSPEPINSVASTPPARNLKPATTTQSITPTIPEDLDLRWHSWKCLVCDYFYEGHIAKSVCPRCGNSDPDKFD